MDKHLTVFRNDYGKQLVFEAYDSIINSIGIQYQDIFLSTKLGETHIITTGKDESPPLVLIHAYYTSAASWYKNLKLFSENFKVYNVDIIGDPNKSRPLKVIRQLGDFVDWFEDIMKGLGLDKAFFVGNSVGAYHIMNYYLHFPQRVNKMVLIGPAATFRQIMPFYFHTFPGGMTGWSPLVKHAVNWVENGVPFDEEFRKLFYLLLKHGKATNQVFPTVFKDEDLKRVIAPTMIVFGEKENVYNYTLAIARAKKLMKNLKVSIIKNGNHITAATNFEAVNNEITAFLNN